MGRFFPKAYKAGDPLAAFDGLADGLMAIQKALDQMSVHNGHMEWSGGIPTVVQDELDSASGYWRAGNTEEAGDFTTAGDIAVGGNASFGDLDLPADSLFLAAAESISLYTDALTMNGNQGASGTTTVALSGGGSVQLTFEHGVCTGIV
jgi:hypothetical protein